MGRPKKKIRPDINEEETRADLGDTNVESALYTRWQNERNEHAENPGSSTREPTGERQVRRRGPSLLRDIWKMAPGTKKKVRSNDLGQPIGEEGLKLSEFVGLTVRCNCPLNYESWSKVPIGTKNSLVGSVQRKFEYSDCLNSWLKMCMAKKFRDYKADLKCIYFDRELGLDMNLRNCPPEVPADQWQFLVSYWMSEKGKQAEKRGKESRQKQTVTHTSGSKSFARVGAELEAENGGQVGEIRKYEATHTRKDGSYLDPSVKDTVEKANAKKIEMSSSSDANNRTEIQILSEVLGTQHHGRVPGLGMGPTPTSVFGPFSSTSATSALEIERLENTVKEQGDEISILKAQVAQLMSAMSQSFQIPANSPGTRPSSHSSHNPTRQ